MADLSVIDIAPNGDIVIKAGQDDNTVTVRIHSLLLKVASPVFIAMLSTNFFEGSAAYSPDRPLLLPDDNGPAFLQLCKIIHCQTETGISLDSLTELLVIADKYQCVEAITPLAAMALTVTYDSTVEDTVRLQHVGSYDAVCIAWVLADARLLWRTSRSLIAHGNVEEATSKGHAGLLKLIPDNLSGTSLIIHLVPMRILIRSRSTPSTPDQNAIQVG